MKSRKARKTEIQRCVGEICTSKALDTNLAGPELCCPFLDKFCTICDVICHNILCYEFGDIQRGYLSKVKKEDIRIVEVGHIVLLRIECTGSNSWCIEANGCIRSHLLTVSYCVHVLNPTWARELRWVGDV
eukprot:XP_001710256.1 Hypothetical protein GL50803_37141 [Giardia lamblia ATCC 50803]